MRKLWIFALALTLVCAAVGCSDDDSNNGPTPIPGNNNQNNSDDDADIDAADAGGDADAAVPDGDPSPDADGGTEVTDLCDGFESLGTLPGASTTNASGNTADGTNLVDPSCGSSDKREVVFEFTVDQPMRINTEVQSQDTDDWVLALYTGSCDSPERLKCKTGTADVFVAEAGETYYLAVETGAGSTDAAFSLALETTRLDCAPVGSTTCDGDRVTHCESGGMSEVTYECAYACESGACGGDVCDNAIEVASSGTTTFSGSYTGYVSNFNFDNRADCSSSDAGVNTPGQDLVFSLPGLSAGQEVVVDASADEFQNAIFVMEGCSSQEACVAGGLQVDEILEWTVPDDGDYHVVVDLLEEADGDFEFTITR